MSSISLPLKMLIAGTALAGLTLLACGGDDGGGDSTPPKTTKDAGTSTKDASVKKDAAAAIPHAVEGEDCTGIGGMCDADACDTAPCFAACTDGVYGPCDTLTNLIPKDAGSLGGGFNLPDGGSIKLSDGGVTIMIGDASVNIPATACPDSLMCSNIGASFGAPIAYCSADGLTPPACSSATDCTDMGFKASQCGPVPAPLNVFLSGKYCLQVCNP